MLLYVHLKNQTGLGKTDARFRQGSLTRRGNGKRERPHLRFGRWRRALHSIGADWRGEGEEGEGKRVGRIVVCGGGHSAGPGGSEHRTEAV